MRVFTVTAALTAIIVLRYFAIAGCFYLIFYKWKRERFKNLKIDKQDPKLEIVRREMFWSTGTAVIFGFAGALTYEAWLLDRTQIYFSVSHYGWLYLFFSGFVALFIHDTYFYWMHRLVHHPKLFRRVHQVHHDSNPPTPFAAFSFHWIESILEAFILPAIVFVVPLHIGVVLFLLVLMTVTSVINHLGYEIYPVSFRKNKIGKYWISATNHQRHHKVYVKNFGLYFTWWDEWMGTLSVE